MLTRRPGSTGPFPRTLLLSLDLRAGRVDVRGDLDRSCARYLLAALAAMELTEHPVWTVHGAGIGSCDTGGLRVLAQASALAAGSGRSLRLVEVPPFLAHLVALAELGHLLTEDAPPDPGGLPTARGPSPIPAQALRCSTKS